MELCERLIDALADMPSPRMIQCSTATRASAVYMLEACHTKRQTPSEALDIARKHQFGCLAQPRMTHWLDECVTAGELARNSGLLFRCEGLSRSLHNLWQQFKRAEQDVDLSYGQRTCRIPVAAYPRTVGPCCRLNSYFRRSCRQLFDTSGSGTFTYLLADRLTLDGVLIDPVLEMADRDLAVIDGLGVRIKIALNTHCHADHVTATGLLKQRVPGLRSAISAASGAMADIKLTHGERVEFGAGRKLEARERTTPRLYTRSSIGLCPLVDFSISTAPSIGAIHRNYFRFQKKRRRRRSMSSRRRCARRRATRRAA